MKNYSNNTINFQAITWSYEGRQVIFGINKYFVEKKI